MPRVLWVATGIDYFDAYVERINRLGYEVILVNNLEKAVEILSELHIDVLITDLVFYSDQFGPIFHVKERTRNGVFLLRKIREGNFEPLNYRNMPVIVFTSFFDFLDVSDGKNISRDFIDPKRDVLIEMIASLRTLVGAIKTAITRASLPPGEVRIL